MTAPIVRDPTDACSFDNRGQMVWAYLPPPPPPPLRKTNRLRRVAIIASVAVLLAMLALVAVALTADASVDQPGRPTWVCRHKLVSVSSRYTVYRWVCTRVAK